MSVGKLIAFFSTFTRLPVYVEDVCAQIVEMGIQDEILLVPMDVPPEKLLGMLVSYEPSTMYGETRNCSIIFYNTNVSRDLQRVICCKELMHLLDGKDVHTSTSADFSRLVDGVLDVKNALPASPLPANNQALLDHMALLMAYAVLFPHEIRDDFISAHDDGRMSVSDIAEELDIPTNAVSMLLDKSWEAIRAILLRM